MRRVIFILLVFLVLAMPTYAINGRSQTAYVPAVYETDMGFQGVLANVTVTIAEGNGHVYVDTLPLTEIDTQSSARLAKEVTANLLGIDMSKYDIFVVIRSNSPIIGGPSAGGALTALTMATVLNLTVDGRVIMTGTINPDGSIGPVGGVLEKAQAVAENNGKMFLIPYGQGTVVVQKAERKIGTGVVQIISHTETIDIIKHAKDNWNLDVIEIKNVKDAIKYMTGYEIKSSATSPLQNIENVQNILKEMAKSFLDETTKKFNDAKSALDNAHIASQYSSELQNIVKEQEEEIENAQALFNNNQFYSASSKSFGVSIYATYVKNMVNVLEASNTKSAAQAIIDNANDAVKLNQNLINASRINSATDVEIVAAAEERINEARERLDDARQKFYALQYADAVYSASYATERALSAAVWYGLISEFDDNYTFDYNSLKPLAERRIEDAESALIYAQAVGIDTTQINSLLASAQENLNDGIYSSAISNAVMIRAQANFLMEVRGMDLHTKVDSYDDSAMEAIDEAQKNGAIPILALSYYEYANSFGDDGVQNKLIYLKYAKEFATFSRDLASLGKVQESDMVVIVHPVAVGYDLMLIIIFLAGLVVGVAASAVFKTGGKKRRRIYYTS
ncbi:MAG: S16 family serine protease [Candidatus Aenigmatarchaeota archaeon]